MKVLIFLFVFIGPLLAADRIASVNLVVGDAQFYKTDVEKSKSLRVGKKLKEGVHITTGEASQVELHYENGTILRLAERSTLKISKSQMQDESGQTELWLEKGKLFFKVTKLSGEGSHFLMSTPTSTASIRGTEGSLESNGTNSLAWLKEGKLELTHSATGEKLMISDLERAVQDGIGFELEKFKTMETLLNSLPAARERMNKVINEHQSKVNDLVGEKSTDAFDELEKQLR
jgi:hypothetical protein